MEGECVGIHLSSQHRHKRIESLRPARAVSKNQNNNNHIEGDGSKITLRTIHIPTVQGSSLYIF
jgi:hypothetical protein